MDYETALQYKLKVSFFLSYTSLISREYVVTYSSKERLDVERLEDDRIPKLILNYKPKELRFVLGTHCCERVVLVSVQSAASASAMEIKDSRMQLRRATSAVHKRAAKCAQADGDIF
ncbi:hypothetical protein ANN_08307 [Periplaneta americana]|uniref:Uncharacterized protein n=1 Tax=Periplaneta americana TaxID=6978 RepID=A0ABQ8T118_PERAM|nr:hypothetical protein ANN_08307 [Periplaneta americana]